LSIICFKPVYKAFFSKASFFGNIERLNNINFLMIYNRVINLLEENYSILHFKCSNTFRRNSKNFSIFDYLFLECKVTNLKKKFFNYMCSEKCKRQLKQPISWFCYPFFLIKELKYIFFRIYFKDSSFWVDFLGLFSFWKELLLIYF